MPARWRGSGDLRRSGGPDVAPGEAFDPTDAERSAFGDLIERAESSASREAQRADACDAVKADGDVCGRELPCRYHSEDA